MKLSIILTGEVPTALRDRFGPYAAMFQRMFDAAESGFDYEVIPAFDGNTLPDPGDLQAVLITGSAAGVYDELAWLAPLRDFIRKAYAVEAPMLGICFGHQIMADALGGEVRRSEKGWGLGRHNYRVVHRPDFMADAAPALSIACSHQDQVIVPPAAAKVILASEFTPNAGLLYKSGRAMSLQPHPEFADDYTMALAELRRGIAPDAVVEAAVASLGNPSDSAAMGRYLTRFLAA